LGCRVLHLYKKDWEPIHKEILDLFDLSEEPVANVRDGDTSDIYKEHGCKVKIHKAGYRSVHYLAKIYDKQERFHLAEIQVRTIFEEGWSEIDHLIRYPYFMDHPLINQFLSIFNRLAGSADEMGTFLDGLVDSLKKHNEMVDSLSKEREESAKKIDDLMKASKMKDDEKQAMQKEIDKLKKQSIPQWPRLGSAIFQGVEQTRIRMEQTRIEQARGFQKILNDIGVVK
jgi:hypothetical protein